MTLVSFSCFGDALNSSTITLVDAELNNTTSAATNLLDDDITTHWLSSQLINDINFSFVDTIETQCLTDFNLTNYANSDTGLRQFALFTTNNGSLEGEASKTGWKPMIADANPTENIDYLYWIQGARLVSIDNQYSDFWSGENINDGDLTTRWLSNYENNVFEYEFDTNWDGQTGDDISISEFEVINYGDDDRSVRSLQIDVTTDGITWQSLEVPNSVSGDTTYNYNLNVNGGKLIAIDSEYDSNFWAAAFLQDNSFRTRWLSKKSNNTLEFTFDPNGNGQTGADGDTEDLFTLETIRLENYDANERSVKQFQVQVKTLGDPTWRKILPPTSEIGELNYNFALSHHGGSLVYIDGENNTTTWAAKNIHDGDSNSQWLSPNNNNTLSFQFDVNEDGTAATASDLFSFDRFYLKNYGDHPRAIDAFQVEVKTASNTTWQKLKVPGSVAGEPDYNFALAQQGGVLVAVDDQLNGDLFAGVNIHDGDNNSYWLARNTKNNTLDFQFDSNLDGTLDDLFTLQSIFLRNYGAQERAIKDFQIEVKTQSNPNWTKLPVGGSQAGEPNYNFSLAVHGGALSFIDSELNATNYAAKNIHDGYSETVWFSNKNDNTLEFTFDTNYDGITGDSINLSKITLVNYGVDDRSISTFEIDIKISDGAWQTIDAPNGGAVFNADMIDAEQTWEINAYTNVTATRIRTISNHGNERYMGAKQISFLGDTVAPSHTFTAAMHDDGETFQIDAASQPSNVSDIRLRTISNYGDPHIGAKELALIGTSVTRSATFHAAKQAAEETFVLDASDIPVDVTDLRLITISNHGDPDYIGANEFGVLGASITKSKTFIAAMHSDEQLYNLNTDDIPHNVTAVKLVTISNHGELSYTGMQEFSLLGPSLAPSSIFILPASSEPFRVVLDSEDQVENVIGARIYTLENHGSPNYTALTEVRLFGPPIAPSYVFTAQNTSDVQTFQLEASIAEVFRFHSISNYGHSSHVRARDFSVGTGICKTAQWNMDDVAWRGASNEVLDSTGSGYHGRALGFGVADDPSPKYLTPVTNSNPGTCHYGDFDGVDDYIVIEGGNELDDIPALTVSAWIKADSFQNTVNTEYRGVFSQGANGTNSHSYSAFFTTSASEPQSQYSHLTVDIDGDNDRFISNTQFTIDTWYHVAIVFDGTQPAAQRVKLYVNGVLDGTFSESSDHIPDTQGGFYIGNAYLADTMNVFAGAIDEFTVLPSAISEEEINYLMNRVNACAPLLHHIKLEHSGSGLSCSPETITLKACANSECSSLLGSEVEVNLSSTGANSNWSQNPVTIPAGSSVEVQLYNREAESITLNAVPSLASQQPIECEPQCDITFHDSGYLLSLDNHASCSIATLNIQAVKSNETSTSCAPAYTGVQPVDFTFNYSSPVDGTKLPLLDGSAMAAAGSAQTRNITFDANASANIDFTYEDAGKISINVSDAANSGLASSTVTSVVYPAKLVVNSPDSNVECTSANGTCSVFKAAGEAFNLQIAATCQNNTVTPNFVMNDIPLSVNTIAPALGNPVNLDIASINFVAADEGIHIETEQAISEVGVFSITATPPVNSYFGETIPSATSENIGRFTPAYFSLEVIENGIFNSGNGFIYSGQMTSNTSSIGLLSYLSAPEFTVSAKNEAAITTKNYVDDFAKLTLTDIVRAIPTSDSTQLGVDGETKLDLTANLQPDSITINEGVSSYLFASSDNYVYTRNANALIAPFTSDIDLTINTIIDSDGIAAQDTDNDATNGLLTLHPFGEELRFGRWVMDNGFGAETSELMIPMQTQYWNGHMFVTNTLDNATSFSLTTDVSIEDISLLPASTTVVNSGIDYFLSGQAGVLLSSPGEGNLGRVLIKVNVPAWLQYNWPTQNASSLNTFSDNPAAEASFGIYRGDDRTLYWREVLN
jgi:hypothetical protein